jgi:arylsulfatase A-like enzyme
VANVTSPLETGTSPRWPAFSAGLWRALAWSGRKLWQPLGTRAPQTGRLYADLVSLVFAVCAAIFLTKAVLASLDLSDPRRPPLVYDGDWLPSLGRVLVCCAQDLAVGLGCLLAAALALRLAPARAWRGAVQALVYVAALAALFLTVVDAHLFHQLRRFLTLDLFQAGGGFQMETSIEAYAASPAFKVTAVLLPLVTLAFHLGVRRSLGGLWHRAAAGLCRPAVLLLLVAGLLLASDAARGALFADGVGDFADNPHLLLVRSFFAESAVDAFAGPASDEDEPAWPPDLVEDFLPGRPRPSGLVRRRPHNIVVIAVESLAVPYLELYGAPFPNTPNLCRLQKKGVVFTNFYATATKTICSALPLFGSTYNDVTARLGTAVDREGFPVPAASTWLKQQGYKTYFLTGNGHGWDVFMNLDETFTRPGLFDVGRDEKHPFWTAGGLDPGRIHQEGYMDKAAFDDARRALRDARGHKFYLMLWNYETHYPYYPGAGPSFDRRRFPEALAHMPDRQQDFQDHLKGIWRLDALIGEFYQELEDLGLADDTLVVITGDHGEAWGQHGTWIHGDSVYQEEVHVPLILLCPPLAAQLGPRQEVVGDHVDLWPTIADICGLPADPRWQGRSLLGGPPGEVRRAYFNNHGSTMLGVRQDSYKFILDLGHKSELLFDVARDPGERDNIAGRHPDLCERLRQRLQVWVRYQARLTRDRIRQAQQNKTE